MYFDPSAARVTAVIDFGDLAVGDAASDFVFLYEDYGVDMLARVLRAYTPAEPLDLLARAFQHYVLDMIDWVMDCAATASTEAGDAAAELSTLRTQAGDRRRALLAIAAAA